MSLEKKRDISIIMGQQGAGKTTLLKELLRKSPLKRRIIVDSLDEFSCGVEISTPQQLKQMVDRGFFKKEKTFNVVFRFKDEKVGFVLACDLATSAKNCLLVVDEVDMYSNAYKAPPEFSWLVRYGRHNAVNMICIARRPADLWKTLRANANNIYMLRVVDPDDQKYLGSFIGRDLAESLKDLKDLEYICWKRGKVKRGKTHF